MAAASIVERSRSVLGSPAAMACSAARASAIVDATVSRHPRRPQPHAGPSATTGQWPISPDNPCCPKKSRPSATMPEPIPMST